MNINAFHARKCTLEADDIGLEVIKDGIVCFERIPAGNSLVREVLKV
jgi:hypothetical protein